MRFILLIFFACMLGLLVAQPAVIDVAKIQVDGTLASPYQFMRSLDLTTVSDNENNVNYRLMVLSNPDRVELRDATGRTFWTKPYPDLRVFTPQKLVPRIMLGERSCINQDGSVLLYASKGNRYFQIDKTGKETYFPENTGYLRCQGFSNRHWVLYENSSQEDASQYPGGRVPSFFPQGFGILLIGDQGRVVQQIVPRLKGTVEKWQIAPDFRTLGIQWKSNSSGGVVLMTTEGRILQEINNPGFDLTSLAFSESGDTAIWGTTRKQIIDCRNGQILATIIGSESGGGISIRDVGLAALIRQNRVMIINYLQQKLVSVTESSSTPSRATLSGDGRSFWFDANNQRHYFQMP